MTAPRYLAHFKPRSNRLIVAVGPSHFRGVFDFRVRPHINTFSHFFKHELFFKCYQGILITQKIKTFIQGRDFSPAIAAAAAGPPQPRPGKPQPAAPAASTKASRRPWSSSPIIPLLYLYLLLIVALLSMAICLFFCGSRCAPSIDRSADALAR